MSKAIYPGTFDPITRGHLDVIERSSRIFTALVVVIGDNSKKNTLFSAQERLELIQQEVQHFT